MARPASPYRPPTSSFSFGPGRLSTAIKVLIGINVAVFLTMSFTPQAVTDLLYWKLGLMPSHVLQSLWVWQPLTYMFLHGEFFHILFNMLALWMFGTELERLWGTRFFVKFYFITGIGSGLLTILVSLLPIGPLHRLYSGAPIVGASGAIYGLILAYAFYFPNRPIYMYMLFPVPAKVFAVIMGVMNFLAASSSNGGGVASATHLGGLLVGYVYLKSTGIKLNPWAEVKYRYIKWKINRVRKKFDVYSGGKNDEWNRRVH
jgi:membrane associated rhomboid family serine protease